MLNQLTAQSKTYPIELRTIFERGHAGDATVLPELKKALADNPDIAEMLGDMPRFSLESLFAAVTGKSLTAKEAIRRQSGRLRDELAGPDASLPVRMLAERVAITWIEVHHADTELADALQKRSAGSPQMQTAERRAHSAQARFLEAIEALLRVKRLSLPSSSCVDPWKEVARAPHWDAVQAPAKKELTGVDP